MDNKCTICSCKNTGFTINPIELTTEINYVKTREDAIEPTRGSAAAAGYDLYVPSSVDEIAIPAQSTIMIDTGIAIALPDCTFGAIFARSGLATKQGLRPANCVGVIDSDYRGSIGVALHNDTNEDKIIKAGERIAQLVVIPYLPIRFNKVEDLDKTLRGDGAFGSTGE